MNPLRVLTFNIHSGYSLYGERDISRIHDLLETLSVDIAVLQEMDTRPRKGGMPDDVANLAGDARPYRFAAPTMTEGSGWYGNLIVSRYPILRSLIHSLEKETDHIEPRNAADVLIDTPLGKLRILGTHLSLPASERRIEVPMLIKLVKEVEEEEKNPVFLMGDINEWHKSCRLLKFLGENMIEVKAGATFPAFFPVLHLDRVWHDAPYIKAKATVIKKYGVRRMSDHLPILIEIENLKPQ